MTVSLRWQEFDRNDRVVMKEKAFKTEEAMQKFIKKLEQKDNFYGTYATSK